MRTVRYISLLVWSFVAGCSFNIPDKHFKLGEEYLLQGQFQRSVEEYSKIVELVPREQIALTALEKIADIQRNRLKNPHEAIAALRKKFELSSDVDAKVTTLRLIGSIFREDLENPQRAAEEYQFIFQNFGLEIKAADEILLEHAEILREAQLYSAAAGRYQEFLDKFPGHQSGPRAMLNLGSSLLSAENLDRAEESLKKVVEQFQGREEFNSLVAEALFALGNLSEEKDDLDKALEHYRASLGQYPNSAVVELKIKALEKRKKEQKL